MNRLFCLVLLLTFSTVGLAESPIEGRWYSASQLALGKKVFSDNCQVCHGAEGQGLAEDWRQPLADGSYPPPPLNGTAHTWHHPISSLLRTITDGGLQYGGKMPAFGDKLSDAEKTALIARIHDWWPREIYDQWIERGGLIN